MNWTAGQKNLLFFVAMTSIDKLSIKRVFSV